MAFCFSRYPRGDSGGDSSGLSNAKQLAEFFVEQLWVPGDGIRYLGFSLADLEFFWQNNLEVYYLATVLSYFILLMKLLAIN